MSAVRNVLFLMCDQLRADHLGCYGHPFWRRRIWTSWRGAACASTARWCSRGSADLRVCRSTRGVTFRAMARRGTACRCQSARSRSANICDAPAARCRWRARRTSCRIAPESRACIWTATRNGCAAFATAASTSSTAMTAIIPSLRALTRRSCAAWDTIPRIPGRTMSSAPSTSGARSYPAGKCAMRACPRASPKRTPRPRTPPTGRSSSCARGEAPWALHLSYVKPHWPYLAPAPYHARYSLAQCLPLKRDPRELDDAHPVLAGTAIQCLRRKPLGPRFRGTTVSFGCGALPGQV